jgi:Ca2+-binding RTX toxin-like protein
MASHARSNNAPSAAQITGFDLQQLLGIETKPAPLRAGDDVAVMSLERLMSVEVSGRSRELAEITKFDLEQLGRLDVRVKGQPQIVQANAAGTASNAPTAQANTPPKVVPNSGASFAPSVVEDQAAAANATEDDLLPTSELAGNDSGDASAAPIKGFALGGSAPNHAAVAPLPGGSALPPPPPPPRAPVNNSPNANANSAATDENTPVTINVLANDSDSDGDPLIVSAVSQGANGTVAINGNNTVTYIPNANFSGADGFTYTAADGQGGFTTAAVSVAVRNVIAGTAGSEILTGTAADDLILGLDGSDTLSGLAGNDTLDGGLASDGLDGGDGNDLLDGGIGGDTLVGGAGDDVLIWDLNDSTVAGGTGIDTVRLASGNLDVTGNSGKFSGIERIDLAADAGANAVVLTAQDILDESDNDILTLLGGAGDSVNAGIGWSDGGLNGAGQHVYTKVVGAATATLILDAAIAANPDILT